MRSIQCIICIVNVQAKILIQGGKFGIIYEHLLKNNNFFNLLNKSIINDDIERSVDRLNDIIVAAHNVPIRQQEMINEIKKDLEVMTKGEL